MVQIQQYHMNWNNLNKDLLQCVSEFIDPKTKLILSRVDKFAHDAIQPDLHHVYTLNKHITAEGMRCFFLNSHKIRILKLHDFDFDFIKSCTFTNLHTIIDESTGISTPYSYNTK